MKFKVYVSFHFQSEFLQGDSGSPLFLNGKEIIGVNLGWCTQEDNPRTVEDHNLHASIEYYRKFIEAVANPQYGNPPLW